MTQVKPLIYSKQFWVAVAQAVLALIAIFGASYPALQAIGWVGILKSALDIYLRYNTTTQISGVVSSTPS